MQRYWINRPIFSIKSTEKPGTIKKLENMENENAVHWWKYAIKSVTKLIREKKKGCTKAFQLSSAKDKCYQQQFLETFVKIQMKATDITEKERKQYEKIVLIYDIQKLSKYL